MKKDRVIELMTIIADLFINFRTHSSQDYQTFFSALLKCGREVEELYQNPWDDLEGKRDPESISFLQLSLLLVQLKVTVSHELWEDAIEEIHEIVDQFDLDSLKGKNRPTVEYHLGQIKAGVESEDLDEAVSRIDQALEVLKEKIL